jgi:hypothetical protein
LERSCVYQDRSSSDRVLYEADPSGVSRITDLNPRCA